jgi:hypothetical protein
MALPQLKLVMIACFKSCETRVAPENEFGDFTTLLVICPDDSTGIELNPQPTAPLPREGFGMTVFIKIVFLLSQFDLKSGLSNRVDVPRAW